MQCGTKLKVINSKFIAKLLKHSNIVIIIILRKNDLLIRHRIGKSVFKDPLFNIALIERIIERSTIIDRRRLKKQKCIIEAYFSASFYNSYPIAWIIYYISCKRSNKEVLIMYGIEITPDKIFILIREGFNPTPKTMYN